MTFIVLTFNIIIKLTICICVCKFIEYFIVYQNTLSDSGQDGLGQGAAASAITGWSLRWKKMRTQSIIRMIKCGGRPSFLTVAKQIKNL